MSLVIRPIETPTAFRAFFEFPWRLYRDDPNWVPPLLSMRRELLDPQQNPAWAYLDGQYFGAWCAGQLVGTITALVNHRHNDYWDEDVGWFGTFETIDDQAVATALLDTASEWVRARGYSAIRGPQSFTMHEETGLLVRNFNRPVLMNAYNPPYYEALIKNTGFQPMLDTVCFYYDRQLAQQHDFRNRLQRIASRATRSGRVQVRTLDRTRRHADLQLFRDIYNCAWDKNWGFVPMTDDELDALIENLGMLVDPDLAFFAEVDGEAVGFALAVPDFNELLHAAYPRPAVPEWWTLARIVWDWKVRKTVRGARLVFLGVVDGHRDQGIDIALLYRVFDALDDSPYTHIDCGWVLETNPLVQISLKLGADMYKTHRYYQKSLS